jgi:hypothetical protein
MVDSVVFRIHDLHEHAGLVAYLLKTNAGVSQVNKLISEPDMMEKEIYNRRYFVDHASGRSWVERYRNHIRSHNYDISYMVNTKKGYIEFNLSLPKYRYSTNLFQLIDHYDQSNYLEFRNTPFWETSRQAFRNMIQVLTDFVEKELGGYYVPATMLGTVKKEFLEIVRVDLCYNLVFNTEDDCKFYAEQIRGIKKRGLRESPSVQKDYSGDDLSFASKDFTVKVYRKGPEFRKHDYNKVRKRLGRKFADEAHHLAKRILRYEVEFRLGYMTELFNTNLKNTNPKLYRCVTLSRSYSKNRYFYYNNIRYSWDGLSVKGKTCSKPSPTFKQMLEVGNYIRKRDMRFMGKMNPNFSLEARGLDDVIDSYNYTELFDYNLFSLLVESFKRHFLHFNIGTFEHLSVLNNVLEYNREQKAEYNASVLLNKPPTMKAIDKRKIKMLIGLLRDKSWDEIKDMDLFSPASFYRYKKFFKECGFTAQRNHEYDFKVKFDYSNYYDLVFNIFHTLGVKKHS